VWSFYALIVSWGFPLGALVSSQSKYMQDGLTESNYPSRSLEEEVTLLTILMDDLIVGQITTESLD